MFFRNPPKAINVQSELTVSLAYSCYYKTEYKAYLTDEGSFYKTMPDQVISVIADSEKNSWRFCPAGYISGLSAHKDSVQSNEKEHKATGSIYFGPFKLPEGEITVETDNNPRLGHKNGFKTSVLGFSVVGKSIVTPLENPSEELAKPSFGPGSKI